MKLLYIIGLEHSGTTLVSHLLSQHKSVLGLGEVGQWFSPSHMSHYIGRWGDLPDARTCSCGQNWNSCAFWKPLQHLCGLNSDASSSAKYGELLNHINNNFPEYTAIVDASKSIEGIKALLDNSQSTGMSAEQVVLLHVVKDVRNFAESISRRDGTSDSFIGAARAFNWWLGANRAIDGFCESTGVTHLRITYEALCDNPARVLQPVFGALDLNALDEMSFGNAQSHLVMGNKDFIERNHKRLQYDARWKASSTIRLVSLLHFPASRYNRRMMGKHLVSY